MDCNCSSCSCNRKVTDRYYRLTRVVYSGGLVRLNILSQELRDNLECEERLQIGV